MAFRADLRPTHDARWPGGSGVDQPPDASAAAAARKAAAQIQTSLDLISHCNASLELLAEVHKYPQLAAETVLKDALRRYEHCWLPLLVHHANDSVGGPLAAPLDVAWAWQAHAIAPVHYRTDIEAALGSGGAAALWEGSAAASSAPHLRSAATLEATRSRWEALFPEEPFDNPHLSPACPLPQSSPTAAANKGANTAPSPNSINGGHPQVPQHQAAEGADSGHRIATQSSTAISKLKYDITAACIRQFDFWHSTNLPHYREPWFLRRAVQRYLRLLYLHDKNPDKFLVPAYDMDLVWHAHMACSPQYFADCDKLFGSVFAHDDSVNDRTAGSRLNTSWAQSQVLYFQTFGETESADGAMWRGTLPPDWALAAPAPLLDPTAQRPRIFALTAADTGLPLRPICAWNDPIPGGVAMAVQASCYGDPASDCVLLLQHHGVLSAAASVTVLGRDHEVLATGRMVGRETLPTIRPELGAGTPALHWNDQATPGPLTGAAPQGAGRVDRCERAFIVSNRRDTWGVLIASWPHEVRSGGQGSGASERGGEENLQLRLHRLQGHCWTGPWHTAVKQGTRGSEVALVTAAGHACGSAPMDASTARTDVSSVAAAAAAAVTDARASEEVRRAQHQARQPRGLWAFLQNPLRLDRDDRFGPGCQVVGWEQKLARQHTATVAAASAAPLHIEHDSIHIALGDTPEAMPSPTMANPAATHHPAPTAAPTSENVTPGGVHVHASGGSGADAAGIQTHADRSWPSLPPPCARAPADGGGGVCSVVVGAHVGAPEALAVAGCLALQSLMLGVDRPHQGPRFHKGLFAAGGLGPSQRSS